MNVNCAIPEQLNIASGFVPVDMSAGANNGDWVGLKNYAGCACVLFKAAGTAGDDPTFKIQQATANDGTGAKDINFTRIWKKQGTLTAVTGWTLVTQTAATEYTDATSAEAQAIWVVDIKAEDLDVANDFDWIQLSVADIGTNAQVGAGLYILYGPRYGGDGMPSAL